MVKEGKDGRLLLLNVDMEFQATRLKRGSRLPFLATTPDFSCIVTNYHVLQYSQTDQLYIVK